MYMFLKNKKNKNKTLRCIYIYIYIYILVISSKMRQLQFTNVQYHVDDRLNRGVYILFHFIFICVV